MKKVCIILVLALLSFNTIEAQSFTTRVYTTRDGLSDNAVFGLYEDRFGYLWVCTQNGLNRFDGTNFIQYGVIYGMPNIHCDCIYQDKQDRLWIGTRGGPAEFRRDRFIVYPLTDSARVSYVHGFYENTAGQLVSNMNVGQYVFENSQWKPYSAVPSVEVVTKTRTTGEGVYLINAGKELLFAENNGKTHSLWKHAKDEPFFNALFADDSLVYAGAHKALFTINKGEVTSLFSEMLNSRSCYSHFRDSRGLFWISTAEDGILILDDIGSGTTTKTIKPPVNLVYGFLEDRNHQVWAAGHGGLMQITPSEYSSIAIDDIPAGQHIHNLFPIFDDQLLLSISDGRLLIIRPSLGADTYTIDATYRLNLPGDVVDRFSQCADNSVWISTRNGQLYHFEKGRLEEKSALLNNSGQRAAFDVACDPGGDQVVVAADSLLAIGNRHSLDTLYDQQRSFIQKPGQVYYIDSDLLAIRGMYGEITLYNKSTNTFQKAVPQKPAIARIQTSAQKHLWVYYPGTKLSSYVLSSSGQTDEQEKINISLETTGSLFNDYIVDDLNTVWAVTRDGILRIHKSDGQWKTERFPVHDDINTISGLSHIAATDDLIWTNHGRELIYVHRKAVKTTETLGNVVFEKVQLNNQSTDWTGLTDSLTSYFEIPEELRLRHDQNTLTFFYNTPALSDSRQIEYALRLLPDTTWSGPTSSRSVSFYKLGHGDYTLEVRNRQAGEEWGRIVPFSFAIQRAFWETTWFRVLLLSFATALIVLVFRVRLKQERTKGEIRAQLLELEMKALRAQMNPHFIYNALNSIQSLVATNQSHAATRYISMFARLLRQVLENSRNSEVTLNKELESLRLYVQLEQLRLDAEVVFIEDIDDSISPSALLIPPLILQPFVENALWHGLSEKEGEKKVEVRISSHDEYIQCSITDNGVGRQKAAARQKLPDHSSTAIQLTGQRLFDFNGNGTTPVHVEDLYSEDGKPSGTRVLLRIRKKPLIAGSIQ